jgi:histidyl-tRNA synthetase
VVFNPSIIRGFDYYAGPDELNQGTVSLKNMCTGKQVSFSQALFIVEKVKTLLVEIIKAL